MYNCLACYIKHHVIGLTILQLNEVSMQIYKANIFDYLGTSTKVCITTNGSVNKDKHAVLGRGNALQATMCIKQLRQHIGIDNLEKGTVVHYYPNWGLFAFPVKHEWHQRANLGLIRSSCKQLISYIKKYDITKVLLPFPGVGNGKRDPSDVMPILNQEFKGYEEVIYIVIRSDMKRELMPDNFSNDGGNASI